MLFDVGFIRSKSFPFPVIVVGNLNTGGTGKTPHVEYLVKLLYEHYKVATLSRGYGRKTKGFIIADDKSDATQIGDEPMLYQHRFGKNILVGVGEERVAAIEKIKQQHKQTEIIVLDDAFQHRYVKPGLAIVLTEFRHPYFNDYLLPAGNLREPKSGVKRADIIIVTKCPEDLSEVVQKVYIDKINPLSHQQVFFSSYQYNNLVSLNEDLSLSLESLKEYEVLLMQGIANPKPMKKFLDSVCNKVHLLRFPDHHQYNREDLNFIERNFNIIASAKKIIITTEKDAMRLRDVSLSVQVNQLPIYYLPIQVYFINKQIEFNQHIKNYVKKN